MGDLLEKNFATTITEAYEQRDKLEVALLLQRESALTDGARELAFYRPLSHQIPNSNFATRLSPTLSCLDFSL
ncbi:MAG: hypothetical protein ACE361_27235 [Aureliella sp.]